MSSNHLRWLRTVILSIGLIYIHSAEIGYAKTPVVPAGMIWVPGGVVTVGGFVKDPVHWGKREVVLSPYFIDLQAKPKLDFDACYTRGGLFPTIAQLHYALRIGSISDTKRPEKTIDTIPLVDGKQLAETEGAGFYETYLKGTTQLMANLPYADFAPKDWVARCVIPVQALTKSGHHRLAENTALYSGRGTEWPVLVRIYDAPGRPHQSIKLKKGTTVQVLYHEGGWAFVRSIDNDDGWVPFPILILVSAKAKQ